MVNIHARAITPELASLVRQLDGLVKPATDQEGAGLGFKGANRAFVVLLTDDPDAAESKLEGLLSLLNQ